MGKHNQSPARHIAVMKVLGTKATARSGKSTTWPSAVKCQKKVTPSTQATCHLPHARRCPHPSPAGFGCIELQSRGSKERETLRIGVLKHWPAKQMLRIIIFYELFRRNVFEMTSRRQRSRSPKGRKTKPRETKGVRQIVARFSLRRL